MVDESAGVRGPRGGRTTITAGGLVKKNLWMPRKMADQLRRRAYEERRTEAEIVREALRRFFSGGEGR